MLTWLLAASGSAEGGGSPVIINELDADNVGVDATEFVELYDGGAGNISLTGLVVVFYNGSNDRSYAAFDLDGFTTDGAGFFTLGNAAVPGVDLMFAGDTLQNGADAVALYQDDASSFPNLTLITTTNLVDAVVYDTSDADDAGLLVLLNAGQPQVDENGGGSGTTQAIARCVNGSGGPRNTGTYAVATPSPDATNICPRLTLTILPASFWEDAGANAATATVTRTDDPNITNPRTVLLVNPDTSEITIPASVTIPATLTAATFLVNAIDDALVDGTQTVTVTAQSAGLANATANVAVLDSESVVPISMIQGQVSVLASPANLSPFESQIVSIRGVVTNLAGNGFYLQEATADDDGNTDTSDGIFVFTSSAPAVVLGNLALVTGTVIEFTAASSGNLSVTEIINPTIAVLGTIADVGPPGIDVADLDNAVEIRTLTTLPDALVFSPGNPNDPNTGIEFYETIEGALVEVTAGTVVGPTNQLGATREEFTVVAPGNAGAGSGYFPPTHNLIIQPFDAPYTNPASPPTIGGGDFNPERIIVGNRGGLIPGPEVAADGTVVSDIVGTIAYDFGTFKIQPVFALTNVAPGFQSDPLTPQGANVGFTTFNVADLFDTINEPGRADAPILTVGELDTKLTKLTLAITQQLALPDVLVLEEVENEATAQQLANRVNSATGGATNYMVRSLDAADDRSLEVGFLYNANRVSLLSVFNPALLLTPPNVVGDDQHLRSAPVGPFADVNLGTAFIADTNLVFQGGPGAPFSDGREPLVGVFHFNDQDVLVIGLHLTSKGGDGPLFGVTQPPQRPSETHRSQQAAYVRQLVDLFFNGDAPRAIPAFTHILVAGDFSDFQFPEQGEVGNDAVSIIQGLGVPANRFLHNLVNDIAPDQRYSSVIDGSAQQLDHMLVSPALLSLRLSQDIAHFNADYPASQSTSDTTAIRSSDHDPLAGTFALVPLAVELMDFSVE